MVLPDADALSKLQKIFRIANSEPLKLAEVLSFKPNVYHSHTCKWQEY